MPKSSISNLVGNVQFRLRKRNSLPATSPALKKRIMDKNQTKDDDPKDGDGVRDDVKDGDGMKDNEDPAVDFEDSQLI